MIRVDIGKEAGGTRVALVLDGTAPSSMVRGFSMSDPPRHVVQLRKVVTDAPYAVIPAGTPELVRVRLGYHEERRPPYLQIVLDLRDGGVRVRQELSGDTLILHLGRRSQ